MSQEGKIPPNLPIRISPSIRTLDVKVADIANDSNLLSPKIRHFPIHRFKSSLTSSPVLLSFPPFNLLLTQLSAFNFCTSLLPTRRFTAQKALSIQIQYLVSFHLSSSSLPQPLNMKLPNPPTLEVR